MSNSKINTQYILGIVSLVLLSACSSSSVIPVAEVTSDQMGYLSKKFSPQSLSPALAKKLPPDDKSTKFERLIFTMEMNLEKQDGKKESWKSVITYFNSGNGLVQKMHESSNNDIPYALYYSLTYKGIVDLRWQSVPLHSRTTNDLYEIKDTTRFDAVPAAVNKESIVEYTSGSQAQTTNFFTHQKLCKVMGTRAASELHKKLPGQVTDIECQLRSNNVVQHRTKWAMLHKYGMAIPLESADVSRKTVSSIVDFNESLGK